MWVSSGVDNCFYPEWLMFFASPKGRKTFHVPFFSSPFQSLWEKETGTTGLWMFQKISAISMVVLCFEEELGGRLGLARPEYFAMVM